MKNTSLILKTSLRIFKKLILPVLFLVMLMLTFGQVATAQDEPFRIKGKETKEYLVDKYKLKKSEVRSEIQQTPNGPKGKISFSFMGKIKPKKSVIAENNIQERARVIAKAFLQEETDLFGITNMDEIREVRIKTSKGRNGDFTMIRYNRFINGLQFDNAYIWITVGPDDDVTIVQAELIPASPELYEAVKKKTLSEAEIRSIVEKDLESTSLDSKDINILEIKKVAIPSSPYVIFEVDFNFNKAVGRMLYKINAFTGSILEKIDILL